MGGKKTTYEFLDVLSKKWWFLLVLFLLFFLPSYSREAVAPQDTPALVVAVLSNAFIYAVPALFPVFKLLPIVFVLLIVLLGSRALRPFGIYSAALSFAFAVLQNMARTGRYGFAVLTGNFVLFLLVAAFWMLEAVERRNEYADEGIPWWRYWVVPFAIFALWFPVDTETLRPDFSLSAALLSEAGLTYCMMTPVLLSIVTLFCSSFNRPALRVSGFIGMIVGVTNVVQWFSYPGAAWLGILHIPLLVVSGYAFVFSFPAKKREKRNAGRP